MAMNKWVKKKWIKALKSGEYEKGKGRLGSFLDTGTPDYCCLGVLVCEMAPEFVLERNGTLTVDISGDYGYLPDDLAIMWGLDRSAQDVLSRKNDFTDTFDPVIAYIEDNL